MQAAVEASEAGMCIAGRLVAISPCSWLTQRSGWCCCSMHGTGRVPVAEEARHLHYLRETGGLASSLLQLCMEKSRRKPIVFWEDVLDEWLTPLMTQRSFLKDQ